MPQRLFPLALTVLLASVSLVAQRPVVGGTVVFDDATPVAPTAVLEVTLEDVSRVDVSAPVLARVRKPMSAASATSFELPFDARRIDPKNRYALRATVQNGGRVLFTTTDTALVLTQGRGSSAVLRLHATAANVAGPAAPTVRAAARPAPPLALRDLPATFVGTVPCDGCPSSRYELNLFSDDSFFARTTRSGRGVAAVDELGTWTLSSDRRVIVLRTAGGRTEWFDVRDGATLRKRDASSAASTSSRPLDLRKQPVHRPLDLRVTVNGVLSSTTGTVRLVECSTGQAWTLGGDAGVRQSLMNAPAAARLGQNRVVAATGRVQTVRRTGGQGTDRTFIAERMEAQAESSCAPRLATLPLEGTYWRATIFGATPASAPAGSRTEPSIVFRAEPRSFGGSGGCNRFAGHYEVADDGLVMSMLGRMVACPGVGGSEAAMLAAFTSTRRYRIVGHELELFDGAGLPVARFEGRP